MSAAGAARGAGGTRAAGAIPALFARYSLSSPSFSANFT